MGVCPACFHWALPLAFRSERTVEGITIAMRFEQWLLYHLHVNVHQRDRWPGEWELS